LFSANWRQQWQSIMLAYHHHSMRLIAIDPVGCGTIGHHPSRAVYMQSERTRLLGLYHHDALIAHTLMMV